MIKKLLANVGDYKKASLLTPVYVAGEVALDVIMPLIMAMMIDQGIEKGHAGVILRYGGLLFVLIIGTDARNFRRTNSCDCFCRFCSKSTPQSF